jgi:hypothetical protein
MVIFMAIGKKVPLRVHFSIIFPKKKAWQGLKSPIYLLLIIRGLAQQELKPG